MEKNETKKVLFKSLKESGKHVITIVKGGQVYFMKDSATALNTELYQIEIQGGGVIAIPEDEQVIVVDKLTKLGKMIYTVDFLREKVKDPSSGLIEVTEEELRKQSIMNLPAENLASAVSTLLRDESELKGMKKDKLFQYVESLSTLGLDVSKVLALKTDTTATKDTIIEEIMKLK